jgi:hypothetical protein
MPLGRGGHGHVLGGRAPTSVGLVDRSLAAAAGLQDGAATTGLGGCELILIEAMAVRSPQRSSL